VKPLVTDLLGERAVSERSIHAGPSVQAAAPGSSSHVLIRLHGDIDLATAAAWQCRLDEAVGNGAHELIVDMGDVGFCDLSALRLLLRTQSALRSRSGRMIVVGPCQPLTLMLAALELEDELPLTTGHDEGDSAG